MNMLKLSLTFLLNPCSKILATSTLIACTQLAAVAQEGNFDPATVYENTCFACHGTGAAHAPEVGDIIEWEIRLEKGLDSLVENTINGLNGIMPARGLCVDCSDDELREIVEYMLENSL
ncbi:MAG: cytochrome c5 family protein [Pseudohongiellaceae bacterium]